MSDKILTKDGKEIIKDGVILDGVEISKQSFREVAELYDNSGGTKKIRKLSEKVFKTLFKLEG